MKTTSLLLILHGSPRPSANEPALLLAKKLNDDDRFRHVAVAYLECNEPAIPVGLDELVRQGETAIVVVPYFLHAGRHVVLDVPEILILWGKKNPEITVTLCDAVGQSPFVTSALQQRAIEAEGTNQLPPETGGSS